VSRTQYVWELYRLEIENIRFMVFLLTPKTEQICHQPVVRKLSTFDSSGISRLTLSSYNYREQGQYHEGIERTYRGGKKFPRQHSLGILPWRISVSLVNQSTHFHTDPYSWLLLPQAYASHVVAITTYQQHGSIPGGRQESRYQWRRAADQYAYLTSDTGNLDSNPFVAQQISVLWLLFWHCQD
jgi:hypothetical protein